MKYYFREKSILVQLARVGCFFVFSLFTFFGFVRAGGILSSADILDSRRIALTIAGRHMKQEPQLSLTGSSGMQLSTPGSGGTQTVFPDSRADVNMESESDEVLMLISLRPGDGFHYRAIFGTVRSFEVQYASGSYTNTLSQTGTNFLYGIGLRWNVSPDTLVSSAIAFDVSYIRKKIALDRFRTNNFIGSVNQSYDEDEFQGAVNVSRRLKKVEPFGGLKLLHRRTQLIDKTSKAKVSGSTSGVSPFLGVVFEVFPRERLIVEASFIEDESISAGFNILF